MVWSSGSPERWSFLESPLQMVGPLSCHGPQGTSFSSSCTTESWFRSIPLNLVKLGEFEVKVVTEALLAGIASSDLWWSFLQSTSCHSGPATNQQEIISAHKLCRPVASRANDPSVARN